MSSVLVIGSANRDLVVPVANLPRPGETVPGKDPVFRFGGKGANQAVAAARCGAAVRFMGAVGDDAGGGEYIAHLRGEGVDVSGVVQVPGVATGTAVILVEESAQNMIVVSPGANGACTAPRLAGLEEAVRQCGIVLLQLEIPLETVHHVIELAGRHGKPVLLNPSPIPADFRLEGLTVEYLVVNSVELETLAGFGGGGREDCARAAESLRRDGVRNVIVTRGAEPTLLAAAESLMWLDTHAVEPVDTVGAGDTFAGALGAALREGLEPARAIRFANVAAALSTLKLGAQESMPRRDAVERLLPGEMPRVD